MCYILYSHGPLYPADGSAAVAGAFVTGLVGEAASADLLPVPAALAPAP